MVVNRATGIWTHRLIRVLAAGSLLLMALFWLVHEIDGERRVRIQEGGALILRAAQRERTLTLDEAAALLDRLS